MKKMYYLFGLICLANSLCIKAQDLISCTSCWITPAYSYNSSTHEISIDDMVIKNDGWYDATEYDVAVFIKNTNTNTEYEIDRVTFSGLGYMTNQNQEPLSGWTIDLDFEGIPSGTYRVQIKINDDKKAYETSYTNNTEYFGNASFSYSLGTSAIYETGNFNEIKVYPNPASSILNVAISSINVTESIIIQMYDATGKLIFSKDAIIHNTLSLYVDQFPKGFYFIEVQQVDRKYIQKVTIE